MSSRLQQPLRAPFPANDDFTVQNVFGDAARYRRAHRRQPYRFDWTNVGIFLGAGVIAVGFWGMVVGLAAIVLGAA